ncbi:MAG: TonB family protein [Pseudobdellovibrionaceae bacterium]
MRVLLGILLSLLIHLFLVWSAKFAPLIMSRFDVQPIEVELVDDSDSQIETKNRQIVTEAAPPKELLSEEDYEDMEAYLSAIKQRVKKQSQAAITGATQNRSSSPSEKEDPSPRSPAPTTSKSRFDPRGTLDAFTPKYRTMPTMPANTSRMARGLSTVGEALSKNIEIGSFTALNTDQYLYYSFFSRINDMIRTRWEDNVHQAIDRTPPDRLVYNASGLWTTHLEILLQRNGDIHSTRLMKSSGFRGFDQSAIQAFMEARSFPNPPSEMVESDGLIHIQYSFQVRYEPKVVVRSRE